MRNDERLLVPWLTARCEADVIAATHRVDAASFVHSCHHAGLAGIILERASSFNLPLEHQVQRGLAQSRMMVASRQVNLNCELERVITVLNQARIPVLLLKGAALNLTIYHRSGLRPMSDLDLLVRPELANDALDVLVRNGCRLGYDLPRSDFFPKFHYERELITDAPNPVRIDLHARPFRPLRLSRTMPDDALWEDAQRVRIGCADAWIPRPEFMVVHLVVHAAIHGFERLLWMHDIKRSVEVHHDDLDWTLLTARAEQWRVTLPVVKALQRTAELFGPICPPGVVTNLQRRKPTWRDRLALAHAPKDAANPVMHVAVNVLTTPGWRFNMSYLRALLLPGRAHMGEIYPFRHAAWLPFAHAWRVLRMLGRVSRLPVQGLKRLVSRPATT